MSKDKIIQVAVGGQWGHAIYAVGESGTLYALRKKGEKGKELRVWEKIVEPPDAKTK